MSETDTYYADLTAKMDRMQRRRYDVLLSQRPELDREHFDLLSIEAGIHPDPEPGTPIEDRLASVRRRFREHNHAVRSLVQEVDPQPLDVLEERRIEAWVHETDRSTYRMSARPWLDSDPWWEPGYLDWDGRP